MKDSRNGDISDNEIRIISPAETRCPRGRRKPPVWLYVSVAALILAGIAVWLIAAHGTAESTVSDHPTPAISDAGNKTVAKPERSRTPYTERLDTVIGGVELSVFTPYNAVPVLEIGSDVVDDPTAVLVAQAADVRGDNGEIVGAFIMKGELVSKGEAKAGYCAIVNGELTVGVSDATPMFEEVMMSDGYFFRQYPLVAGGQVVENRPKGRSIRKAIAESDGTVSVIVSHNKVTFREFSQALVDVGVRNAVYLVGGDSYGCYKDMAGDMFIFGPAWDKDIENVSYIVWR